MSKRRLLAALNCVLFLLAAPLALTGCNTVSGAGKDLQEASENTAEAIDNAFDD